MIGVVIKEIRSEAGQIAKRDFTKLKEPEVRSRLPAKRSIHWGLYTNFSVAAMETEWFEKHLRRLYSLA